MKQRCKKLFAIALLPVVLLCTAAYMYHRMPSPDNDTDAVLLLVPDEVDAGNMMVHEWLDAAQEEGVRLAVMHDSEFLNPLRTRRPRGLIVPDLIHRSGNGALVGALHDYANGGGDLMLVYDACTLDLDQHFTKVESRLSDLAGISYALYDSYHERVVRWTRVWGTSDAMSQLEVPPGKYLPASDPLFRGGVLPVAAAGAGARDERYILTRYQYGDVQYPIFRTAGNFEGEVLLEGENSVVAGVHPHGLGHVLFVNVPLGYMKSRTDGLFLHAFLHYFAVRMLRLPYLATAPDGVGGIVFNWHVDAHSSILPLNKLLAAGIFDQGPYSIHFTAGPDVDAFGDGKGLNLLHDPEAQRLAAELMRRHHVLGSHGGWIHNYFGTNLGESPDEKYANFIALNMQAMQQIIGKPVTEYSAPLGNQPQWVTRWLEGHGVQAYYFAGDAGMGPTEVYRDQTRDGNSTWAFPIVHLGKYASMEEMGFDAVPASVVEHWLTSLVDYTAREGVVRLLYTHPFGATSYIQAMQGMLARAQGDGQRFRWYTMTGLATFLNTRKSVQWSSATTPAGAVLEAQAATTLAHQTWILPKARYGKPRVDLGQAQVRSNDHDWLVDAGDCKQLRIEMALTEPRNGHSSSEDK